MKDPILNVSQILQQQNEQDIIAANESWGIISSANQHFAASGIMSIIQHVKNSATAHFFTDGAWSLYELVTALVEITGPATMYVSTYAMSEISTRAIALLKDQGLLNDIFCVIDNRIETRTAASLQLLRGITNQCTLAACHAKVTILEGRHQSVMVLGSANWTENKRLESGIVTPDKAACDFHKQWITKKLRDGN